MDTNMSFETIHNSFPPSETTNIYSGQVGESQLLIYDNQPQKPIQQRFHISMQAPMPTNIPPPPPNGYKMDFGGVLSLPQLHHVSSAQQPTNVKFVQTNGITHKETRTEENDKKREIRLQKNRKSAALSRQRKKEFISNLQKQVNKLSQENSNYKSENGKLTTENWESKLHIERLEKQILKLKNENNELKAKLKDSSLPTPDVLTVPSVSSITQITSLSMEDPPRTDT